MSGKKRIAVISQCFYPEPFRINDLCGEWVRRGYAVTAVTAIPNYPQGDFYPGYGLFKRRKERHEGVEILRLPMVPRKRNKVCLILNYLSFLLSGWIWAHTTRRRFDRVFVFETSPMTQALIGTALAKRLRIPCELYVQDLWPDNVEVVAGVKNRAILNAISRMCDGIYRDCTRIFATSPSFVRTLAARGVPEEKLVYLPQYAEDFYRPLDRETVRREATDDLSSPVQRIPDDDSLKIIFTGNIGAAQGLEILPETAKRLQEKTDLRRKVRFVIVGDGRAREAFEREIKETGTAESFTMIPRQPAERIPALLACCDAAFLSFMNTALFRMTIPAKLQSYMACGMPVLASAEGETARVIREADCGWCCPLGDAEALADAIREMAGLTACDAGRWGIPSGNEQVESAQNERAAPDGGAWERLGSNALAYSRAHFDRQTLIDGLCALWEEEEQP